jgi:uncharacterized membrane protein
MEEIKLSEEEIKDGAPFAALAYVFFLWIITFIWKKDNKFAHFHARQGIAIFIGEIASSVLSLLPVVGGIFYAISLIIFLFLSLYGIYYSLTGRMKRIPFISTVADRFIV